MKKILYPLTFLLFFILLLSHSNLVTEGVKNGLALWAEGLFPALFPYMIISNFVISYGIANDLAVVIKPVTKLLGISPNACYPIFSGLFFGYPSCAVSCNAMYAKGLMDKNTANFCICAFNNISPAFIMGFFCVGVLGNIQTSIKIIPLFYIIVLLSTIMIRIIFFNKIQIKISAPPQKDCSKSILDGAVINSLKSIFKLLGYVCIFSVINSFVLTYFPENLNFFAGLIEVTGGILTITYNRMPVAMMLLLFGGICGIMQTISVCEKDFLDIKKYIYSKLLYAFVAYIITAFAVYVFKLL